MKFLKMKAESVYIYAHQWSKWKMAHKINDSVCQSVYQIFWMIWLLYVFEWKKAQNELQRKPNLMLPVM